MRDDLTKLEATLQSRAEDPDAQAVEVDKAVAKSKAAENSNTPGVYVYTLPHYLKHRVDEETGKTLLKVGHSARDVYYRAGSAGRLTALPEEPILLRIYPGGRVRCVEKQFHAWLNAADHSGTRTRRAGAEWFLTSTKFLDRIASRSIWRSSRQRVRRRRRVSNKDDLGRVRIRRPGRGGRPLPRSHRVQRARRRSPTANRGDHRAWRSATGSEACSRSLSTAAP